MYKLVEPALAGKPARGVRGIVMQVSIETLTGLERKMTIGVPSDTIESQIKSRLQDAAKTFQMKGFRKGKVPLKVIRERYGKGVRQEVLGEVMSQSYYEALTQENVKPAGQPNIEPGPMDEGKDFEFTATFEVFPEVSLGDFATISVEKKTAEIASADIDTMIETLREQRVEYKEVDRAAQTKDQVKIDFVGTVDGEEFEGGKGEGVDLILGSGRMIEGFESGLENSKKDEQVTLKLTFPEQYQKTELAGKDVEFAVTVTEVSEPTLPELNDKFFASFDVAEGGEEAFRKEVEGNMERELKNAVRANLKNQVIEGLVKIHEVEVPKSLQQSEIQTLRQQALQQFGGGANVDPSMLPDELFSEQADKRVKLGLIMNEIVNQKNLKADPDKVKALIEEMAEGYEQPEEVVKWYYSNEEQLASVESMAMEESVIESILESAELTEISVSYEEALKPPQPEVVEESNDEDGSDDEADKA